MWKYLLHQLTFHLERFHPADYSTSTPVSFSVYAPNGSFCWWQVIAPVWASQTVCPHIRWHPHRDYPSQPAVEFVVVLVVVVGLLVVLSVAASVAVVVVVH